MFENKTVGGIYYSRFIMSWIRMGGRLNSHGGGLDDFKEWLKSIEVNEMDIENIVRLASNGKMELETSAGRFIKEKSMSK